MLADRAVIQTQCPVSRASVQLDVSRDGPESRNDGVVHFAVPAAKWWEDIRFTGSTILYFRSEADIEAWCRTNNRQLGGILFLDTAWRLAKAWYHDRLDPGWRRKSVEDAQALFSKLGITGDFWKLNS